MAWLCLAAAIGTEVTGTLCLRVASRGRTAFYGAVAVLYGVAFVFLTLTLHAGLGLGVAYAIWSAAGVALTAVASKLLFGEPLTPLTVAGVALLSCGVLLVAVGAST